MPTVLRSGPYRVMIHTHDHEPANVHVRCGSGVAKISIHPDVALHRIDGTMTRKDASRAVELVRTHRELLLLKWEEIHGSAEEERS